MIEMSREAHIDAHAELLFSLLVELYDYDSCS